MADIERDLQVLIAYNTAQTSNADRWAISMPVMKDLLKQIGKSTQPKINDVLSAYPHAIAHHHAHFTLGERHNRVHQGQSISDVIKL